MDARREKQWRCCIAAAAATIGDDRIEPRQGVFDASFRDAQPGDCIVVERPKILLRALGALIAAVAAALAAGRPLLFYYWEPTHFLTTNAFVRVSAQPWDYCGAANASEPQLVTLNPGATKTQTARLGVRASAVC